MIVVIVVAIWILALNNLFNPFLAMMLMILMMVIIGLDMKNRETEERKKMK